MDGIFRDLDFVFVYLDDILIASVEAATHVRHLHCVFQRLQSAGLAINNDKCLLGQSGFKFLGHQVNASGLLPLPGKIDSILAMQHPATKVGLQRFLGCVNFYHQFLPGIAAVVAPLHPLTSSVSTPKAVLEWTPSQVSALDCAKDRFAQAVTLSRDIYRCPCSVPS